MTAPIQPYQLVAVTPGQRDVLVEFMRDGEPPATIARRLGVSRGHVYNQLGAVLALTEHGSYTALALALERGQLKLRVVNRRNRNR